MSSLQVEKNLLTEEDIAYGEGPLVQQRQGIPFNLSKVRGFYPVNSVEELNALDTVKHPKAVLCSSSSATFYSYISGAWVKVDPNGILADLANALDLAKGAALVGYRGTTVADALDGVIDIASQFGLVGDSNGSTGNGFDNTAGLQAALDYCFASSTRPRRAYLRDGWYRVTGKLTISNAHWALLGESHRVIIWADHDDTAIEVTNAGVYEACNFDVRRVAGRTGVGMKILSSPEGRLDNVWVTGHSDNVQIQDSHLTTMDKCRFSNATNKGLSDLGRCFGSQLIACNIIGNVVGADLKSDWQIVGGALEQNTTSDLWVSTTADYEGKYWGWVNIKAGCHMEGLSGGAVTTDQIVVGPAGASVAGPTAKIGLMLSGSFILGNSSNRTAINFRQGDLCSVTENYFKDYQAGATLIRIGAAATGGLLMGNRWDGTGTFKNINPSATNILDFETENTANAAQVMSITHSLTNGGRIRGVNTISSASRAMNMVIESRRNSANSEAISLRTTGADNNTLFTRIACDSGADVGVVTFPSARVEVAGSYTNPFRIGGSYFWMNGTQFRGKQSGAPTSATDGVLIATLS